MSFSSSRSPITSHVLDTSLGRPARGVEVIIQKAEVESGNTIFRDVASGSTDSDGRCSSLLEPGSLITAGVYKVIFKTQEYFKVTHRDCFYPFVEISFYLSEPSEHYHIPLLLSPYAYTTYRGS